MTETVDGFVLTRQWRDAAAGVALSFWLATPRGPVRVRMNGREAVMFVQRQVEAHSARRREVDLTTMQGKPVDALYFKSRRSLQDEQQRLSASAMTYEADVRPSERFLMERFVTGACRVTGPLRSRPGHLEMVNPSMKQSDYRPRLRVMSLDIETDGFEGPILSIAAVTEEREQVLMAGPGPATSGVRYLLEDRAVLAAFFDLVRDEDPDVLIGWNVVEFDLACLQRRSEQHGLRLLLGRGGEHGRLLAPQREGQLSIARIPGRVIIDGIGALKSATYSFESFGLERVAQELLGRGKAIHDPDDRGEEITRLFREDKPGLAAYNLEDCRLVSGIFERAQLIDFLIERQRMTGLSMGRVGGAVAAFDHLYLPRLHRKGRVAHDVGALATRSDAPGGTVLPSQPGIYDNVLVLDFKSLYPSIIRTFKVDPLGLAFPGDDPIEGYAGGTFARHEHILPQLIESLWAERDRAKAERDAALSRAIKILMNSFYGVLGTPGCRFSNPKLVSSITMRGHEIITRSRDWICERGWKVIYGDTDSLFVLVGEGHDVEGCLRIGAQLADELNTWWREHIASEHKTESYLEMELETLYQRFFMPTLRGSDRGSAKRYAGLVGTGSEQRVIIKGLEAVRTDWTPLARNFQRELLRRVFLHEPYEAMVRDTRQQLMQGQLDEQLVYQKRLRRHIDAYAKNIPPHVRAARMLDRPSGRVRYLMTTQGPEPLAKHRSPIDYHHYLERQLAPAADALLSCLGTDFATIAGDQLRLF